MRHVGKKKGTAGREKEMKLRKRRRVFIYGVEPRELLKRLDAMK